MVVRCYWGMAFQVSMDSVPSLRASRGSALDTLDLLRLLLFALIRIFRQALWSLFVSLVGSFSF